MDTSCPKCKRRFDSSQILESNVASCPNCHEEFYLCEVVDRSSGEFGVLEAPAGASFEETKTGWRLSASTRSRSALFSVPFLLSWSFFSWGSIYWSQFTRGEFDLFLSLVSVPFLLGTGYFGSIALMSICGRVTISVDGNHGQIFSGVGPIGRTVEFDWRRITSVEQEPAGYHYFGSHGPPISLVGQNRIKFASMVLGPRKDYLFNTLKSILANRKNETV